MYAKQDEVHVERSFRWVVVERAGLFPTLLRLSTVPEDQWPAAPPDPLTKSPDAKMASANRASVIARRRRGVSAEPKRCPIHARRPLAVPTLAAAVIMHCTHMECA
jgi:hypothetical protein